MNIFSLCLLGEKQLAFVVPQQIWKEKEMISPQTDFRPIIIFLTMRDRYIERVSMFSRVV